MQNQTLYVLLFVLGWALIFGSLTAASSNRRRKVRGGVLSHAFNWLASALFVSILPAVLLSIFVLHLPIIRILLTAVSLLGLSYLSLLVYALFEKPALDRLPPEEEDRGWTAEDARTSGL